MVGQIITAISLLSLLALALIAAVRRIDALKGS
jgi:hypothetical protein